MRDFSSLNVKRFDTRMQDGDDSGGPEADFCCTNPIFFIQVTDANIHLSPHTYFCIVRGLNLKSCFTR